MGQVEYHQIVSASFYSSNQEFVNRFIGTLEERKFDEVSAEKERLGLVNALKSKDTSGQVRVILDNKKPIGFSSS